MSASTSAKPRGLGLPMATCVEMLKAVIAKLWHQTGKSSTYSPERDAVESETGEAVYLRRWKAMLHVKAGTDGTVTAAALTEVLDHVKAAALPNPTSGTMKAFENLSEVPKTLLLKIRAPGYAARSQAMMEGDRRAMAKLESLQDLQVAGAAIGSSVYDVGLCVDIGPSTIMVTDSMIAKWGMTLSEAINKAMANLLLRQQRHKLRSWLKAFKVMSGTGLYMSTWSNAFNAPCLLLTNKLRAWASIVGLKGQVVAMPVMDHMLLVAGSDDTAALIAMGAVARAEISNDMTGTWIGAAPIILAKHPAPAAAAPSAPSAASAAASGPHREGGDGITSPPPPPTATPACEHAAPPPPPAAKGYKGKRAKKGKKGKRAKRRTDAGGAGSGAGQGAGQGAGSHKSTVPTSFEQACAEWSTFEIPSNMPTLKLSSRLAEYYVYSSQQRAMLTDHGKKRWSRLAGFDGDDLWVATYYFGSAPYTSWTQLTRTVDTVIPHVDELQILDPLTPSADMMGPQLLRATFASVVAACPKGSVKILRDESGAEVRPRMYAVSPGVWPDISKLDLKPMPSSTAEAFFKECTPQTLK